MALLKYWGKDGWNKLGQARFYRVEVGYVKNSKT